MSRHFLDHMQVLEAEELEKLLFAELERTPKHGAEFAAAVKLILQRETRCGRKSFQAALVPGYLFIINTLSACLFIVEGLVASVLQSPGRSRVDCVCCRWAKWKSENCEDFTKDRREPVKLSPLPTHPRLSSLAAPKSKSIDVGSDALNRLVSSCGALTEEVAFAAFE